MLFCPVFAKLHSRPSLDSFSRPTPTPRHPSPKSHGIKSFADPHPLNPVASILYKNSGGKGVPPGSSAGLPQEARRASAFLFNHLRDAHPTKDAHPERASRVEGFFSDAFSLSIIFTIPFFFTLLRTLLHARKTQLLYFQAIPHSFTKTPGGGGEGVPWNF